jgi:hypothetical protein
MFNSFFPKIMYLWNNVENMVESRQATDDNTPCPKKIVPSFFIFFLGAQCVESGVSCTDC